MKVRGPRIPITADPENSEFPFMGLDSWITPFERFYVRNHFPVPEIDPDSWRLRVGNGRGAHGLTLAELQEAAGDDVSDRTIRRDLNALAQAGFPIESARVEGRTRYTLNRDVFGGLAAAGFSLSELCALYLSRTLLSALAGGPFHDSLSSAFEKLADALPPPLWRFVDELRQALAAKAPVARAQTAAPRQVDALV